MTAPSKRTRLRGTDEFLRRLHAFWTSAGNGRFVFLFAALLLFFVMMTISGEGLLLRALFSLVFLGGIRAISQRPGQFRRMLLSFLPVLAVVWLGELSLSKPLQLTSAAAQALFLAMVFSLVMEAIFCTRRVTWDTIFGSICGYILIGFIWGQAYSVAYLLDPSTFSASAALTEVFTDSPGDAFSALRMLTYYSFVTLTTLGYGDISPVGEGVRVLAIIEAIFGQFYVAVLVAKLVSLQQVASANDREV